MSGYVGLRLAKKQRRGTFALIRPFQNLQVECVAPVVGRVVPIVEIGPNFVHGAEPAKQLSIRNIKAQTHRPPTVSLLMLVNDGVAKTGVDFLWYRGE